MLLDSLLSDFDSLALFPLHARHDLAHRHQFQPPVFPDYVEHSNIRRKMKQIDDQKPWIILTKGLDSSLSLNPVFRLERIRPEHHHPALSQREAHTTGFGVCHKGNPRVLFEVGPIVQRLLIHDEPTEVNQPNVVHEIGDVITRLNQESGIAVLLVEQKLPFARRVARNFCILDRGQTMAEGAMTGLTDDLIRQHLTV